MTDKDARLVRGEVFGPRLKQQTIKKITLTNAECDVRRVALVDISRSACDIMDEFVVSLGLPPHPRTVLTLTGPRNTYVGRAGYHYLHDNLIDATDLQLAELIVPGRDVFLEASPMHGWRFRLELSDPEPQDMEFVAEQQGLICLVEYSGTVVDTISPATYAMVRAALCGQDIPPHIEWVVDDAALVDRIHDRLPDPLYDVLKFGACRNAGVNMGAYPLFDLLLGEDARYTALVALVDYINNQGPIALTDEGLSDPAVVTELVEGESFLTYHISKHQIRRAQYEPALAAALRIGQDVGLLEAIEQSVYLTDYAKKLVDLPTLNLVLQVAAWTLSWLIDHDALDTIELEDGVRPRLVTFAPRKVRTTFSAVLDDVTIPERVLPKFVATAKDAQAHPLQASTAYLPGEPLDVPAAALHQPHVVARVTLNGVEPAITRVVAVPWGDVVSQGMQAILCLFGWENNHPWYVQFDAPKAISLAAVPSGQPGDLGELSQEEQTWPVRVVNSRDQVYGPLCYRADAVQLSQILIPAGSPVTLCYDPGDKWRMTIHPMRVEDRARGYYVDEADRACPPEDCGGVAGFERLRQITDDVEGYILSHCQEDVSKIEQTLAEFKDHDFVHPQFPPGCYEAQSE
ncbi:IS1096 element passenger TnpR family protein [Corynebacterium aquilae]|uniref:Plasmid pRiA4b Orf3-like domain-containing protein n=1 Tax=Corynebacterium aquilae DSM 44791 TaxID=1431546 RepID=A0A1L7CH98_9CORY|nr:hypothetical protein [Corynebacterium aquilae]APT85228.1 hypothetical protein CAQU_09255 [Corynebacterium aquilae DSM 44791]